MGTLIKNRQVVGGTPVVDTALDTQSTDVVQNKVVAEAISAVNSNLSQMLPDNRIQMKCIDITVMNATEIASGAVVSQQLSVPSGIHQILSIALYTDTQNYFTTGLALINNTWWYTVKNEYSQKLTTSLKARIVYTI